MEAGKALFVDLSASKARLEELPAKFLEEYLGGRGLAARMMWDWARPPLDPLGPDNRLIFSLGPIQGTGMAFGTRALVSTVSPLTGIYLFSSSGGQLGPAMGRNLCYALVIQGKASSPTYLWILDDRVEFRDARHIWGMKAKQTQAAMLEEVDEEDAVTVAIGPAGENLVRYACIVTEGNKLRSFARGGSGAVMGSKNLKGIAIKTTGTRPIARPDLYLEGAKMVAQAVRDRPDWFRERTAHGTRAGSDVKNAVGILPTRNWWTGYYDKAKDIDRYFRERSKGRGVPCGDYCLTPCSTYSRVEEGPWTGEDCEGPEYESIYALGSSCLVDDPRALVAAQGRCDDWGLDTMSTGLSISFAMECFEKGLITTKDTDGVELTFGNAQAMLRMVDMIARREGFGALLAEGTKVAAQKIGQGSDFFAMHGKGMEFGGYECRTSFGQALQCALGPRGGCHHDLGLPAWAEMNQGTGTEIAGKGALLKETAARRVIFDSAILCTFTIQVLGLETTARLISAIWGKDLDVSGLKVIAERTINLERAINVRFGVTREDDRLPGRLLSQGYPEGPKKGTVVPLEELKDECYAAFGWDLKTAAPTESKLKELGLDEVARELYGKA
ncbi:MAG: aldehyde ferredoxin oxidoreductase family protein [Thermodesulfobacteriota bacterium]